MNPQNERNGGLHGTDAAGTGEGDSAGSDILRLTDYQTLVGVLQHRVTGAFIVFLSLDGDDIRLVAAHASEEKAHSVRQEVEAAVQRTISNRIRNEIASGRDDVADAEVEVADWIGLLHAWMKGSDAPLTPFPEEQLAVIGERIQDVLRQRQNLPPLDSGTARVTVFAPDSPPQATTTPLSLSPLPPMPARRSRRKRRQNA
jgi:hypothetical protein